MTTPKNIYWYCVVLLLSITFTACEKVDIDFGSSSTEQDPNITYFDNYTIDIATYKPDSFLTSGNNIFCLGNHTDPVFGKVQAGSYVQLAIPTSNPVINQLVVFDSLELVLKPNGAFYGDSSLPVNINVYRLTQNIKDDVNGDYYYNTSFFAYSPTPVAQQTVSLYGKTGKEVHIKLSQALGQEWLTKLKTNDDVFASQDNFNNYFKGLYITTDSVLTQSLAYYTASADSMFVILHYHDNGLYPEAKQLNFSYTAAKQFNQISFRHTSASFAAFVNKKSQLIASSASGNQSFLNSNLGASIKISFPDLLNLKALHPYIKIVKATLVVKPDVASYTKPYQLPSTLYLYQTNENNEQGLGIFTTGTTSQTLQTGSLVIDDLYGENTYYSYDITAFINNKIAEGQFSKSALLLYQSLDQTYAGIQRLIVNDQTKNQTIQLKLYVLGL